MTDKILWIEGKRAFGPSFIPGLRKKGYIIDTTTSGKEALDRLPEVDPDLVVLNAASMRTTGTRICRSLRAQSDGIPVLVISDPDKPAVENICANVVLVLPFTTRKLVNRIKPLMPGDKKNIFNVGPIYLDKELKQVRCQGREATLTPRLAKLLKILMDHPGEALVREQLFRDVWNTEYTGDTRTLDVHISWLRQAIEENPRKPRFLKTIRGVGYRLDV
ncbi:response regulator transcription factor [Chloroflexota bacterium]